MPTNRYSLPEETVEQLMQKWSESDQTHPSLRGTGGEYRPTDNIHSVQSINGRFINNFACILLRVHRHNQTTVNYHRATMRMENINEK